MKKILPLAIISLFTVPIASIAADRAPDATINAALEMITPGYCENAFMPDTPLSKTENWYKKAEVTISSCYNEANKNKPSQKNINNKYFSNDVFQERYANFTKDLYGNEIDETTDYLSKIFNLSQDRLNKNCVQYLMNKK
ncbi:hypothetical protein [Commensalibacter intestini]|nr:hypothetical protein [Commensalibacter intestini]